MTAKEIKEINELDADFKAAEQTLKVALNYHANTVTGLHKKNKEWWEHIRQRMDIPKGVRLKMDTAGPICEIVSDEEKEI